MTEVIAAAVRSRRAALRWRQSELAERMHWSQQTASQAEKGARQFTAAELLLLAEVFDMTVDRLLNEAPRDIRERFGFSTS